MHAARIKSITTARKSILKLVKLQSLIAKCCKMQKIQSCKFHEFCMLLYYMQKFAPLLSRKWCKLQHANKSIQNLLSLKCYIFRILQHFATKLCNFTNFRMLFLAVVIDFVLLAQVKISSIAGIIHWIWCKFVFHSRTVE